MITFHLYPVKHNTNNKMTILFINKSIKKTIIFYTFLFIFMTGNIFSYNIINIIRIVARAIYKQILPHHSIIYGIYPIKKLTSKSRFVCLNSVKCHLQQFFSYLPASSFYCVRNWGYLSTIRIKTTIKSENMYYQKLF